MEWVAVFVGGVWVGVALMCVLNMSADQSREDESNG